MLQGVLCYLPRTEDCRDDERKQLLMLLDNKVVQKQEGDGGAQDNDGFGLLGFSRRYFAILSSQAYCLTGCGGTRRSARASLVRLGFPDSSASPGIGGWVWA
ncbi:hypothetical protein E3N88_10289 [Mikania micrantha]|uniref:Uncharacterized protein n=1 Tax=Mikania micrantha TaxID=192012 RepID=A0A5N6PB76_9ASTR|nr:hypothetical protein E3N88_10289 [Mikania micrantha]